MSECATAGCSLSPTQHGDYALGGALVGNATHLFRYDPSGTLYKYPKASTSPEYLTGLYRSSSFGFAVDATTIAFTNTDSSIRACPVAGGCGGTGTPLFPNPDGVITDVVADASGVNWAVKGTAGAATGAVRRCALPDCAGGPKDVAKDQASPVALALDNELVYWANSGTGATNTGAIVRVRK